MSSPFNNNSMGPLGGHGIGVAMVAIFVGVGLIFAFVASGGSIFGMNLRPNPAGSSNSTPVNDRTDVNGIGNVSLTENSNNEGSVLPSSNSNGSNNNTGTEASSPPKSSATLVGSTQREQNATLSEDQKELLAISGFHWDSVAQKYLASNLLTVDTVKQNSTEQSSSTQQSLAPSNNPSSTESSLISSNDDDYYNHLIDKIRSQSDSANDIDTQSSSSTTPNDSEQSATDSSSDSARSEPDNNSSQESSNDSLDESDNQEGSSVDANNTGINIGVNITSTDGSSIIDSINQESNITNSENSTGG